MKMVRKIIDSKYGKILETKVSKINRRISARSILFKGKATIYQYVTIAEADKNKMTITDENAEISAGVIGIPVRIIEN